MNNRLLIRILSVIITHWVLLGVSILVIVSGLVYRVSIEPNIGWVSCPLHMAIEIPTSEPFAGSFIECRYFNKMQRLLEVGRTDDARKLLLVVK